MQRPFAVLALGLFTTVVTTLAIAAAERPKIGGGYKTVVKDDMPRLEFNHYFDENEKHHDADFSWVFKKDGTFEIKAGDGPIAEELRGHLMGEPVDAELITGRWTLRHSRSGKTIVIFSEVTADGEERQVEDSSYSIYRTAPTVVRIGEPQYVFGVRSEDK